MNYKNFGELLKALRLEKGWSQQEACKDICDRRTYIRWEKNISEPSIFYFNLLSKRFNYDLQAYYKLFICDKSFMAWEYIEKANQYINNNDWVLLYECIEEMQRLSDFTFGENKMTLLYYLALYYNKHIKDYNISINYCIKGLKEEDIRITLDNPIGQIYSNIGLCLLNCLSSNFKKIDKHQQATNIYLSIINNIDNKIIPNLTYYQSSEFEKKLYQTIIHNLCLNYKNHNNISLALEYINKGINFSKQHNYLAKLPDLLELKFKLLYIRGDYKNAKQAYDLCSNLYLFQDRFDEYSYCKRILHSDYPELLQDC